VDGDGLVQRLLCRDARKGVNISQLKWNDIAMEKVRLDEDQQPQPPPHIVAAFRRERVEVC